MNHCPHGNWYFLPWHRAYLLYFEQICRELSGYKKFALPYWNWSANPSIPAAFWGGAANPLFDGTRVATAASVANSGFVGPAVLNSPTGILNEPNFFAFASGQVTGQRTPDTYGRLEGTPHNYIHGFVGGDMGTYMSPLDAIFWTHHNMIECCWVEWNLNRSHPNSNDPAWTNFSFPDFVDKAGAPVTVTVAQTFLFPIFSYRFEPCFPGATMSRVESVSTEADAKALEKFAKEGAPVRWEFLQRFELRQSVEVTPERSTSASIPIEPGALRTALESSNRLLLTLGGVTQPKQTSQFVRVFINKPDASQQTPIEDPHYAGSFAFFVDQNAHDGHDGANSGFLVDVTEALRRLNSAGSLASRVEVNLVSVPFEGREKLRERFTLQRLELGVAKLSQ